MQWQAHERTVSIGNRAMFLQEAGIGMPTVICDAGLGGTHADWDRLMPLIAPTARIISYDRAGMGRSDARSNPHTSQDTVNDLAALLGAAEIPSPYLLVAHSLAAFTAALYCYQHRAEVHGLVLVDPAHPDQYSTYFACLPPPTSDEPEVVQTMRNYWSQGVSDPARNSEGIDIPMSCAQVRQMLSFGHLPLAVLTSGDFLLNPHLAPGVGQRLHAARWQLHERWAAMSSRSTHRLFAANHHDIAIEEPESVAEIIRGMMLVS